jgi:streptogramin lyase
MLALYRCGRQEEALDAYRSLQRRLDDRLGVEPTPATKELERAILVQDPALEAPVGRVPPRVSRRRRRRWAALASVPFVVAALGLGVVVAAGGDEPATARVAVKSHSLVALDPATNAVAATYELGGWPRGIVAGGGYLWAARTGDDTVVRIDPVNRLVLDAFFATTPLDLAWRRGVLWIANGNSFDGPDPPGGGTVERFDLAARRLVSTRVGPAAPGNSEQTVVAAGAEGVWAGNGDESAVYRLDPRTGKVAARVPETIQVVGLAVGHGAVWATDAINDVVVRIDPRTARVVARIPVADGPRHLAVGADAVWVVAQNRRSGVWRIDPRTNSAVARILVPRRANWVAVGGGSVWVTSNTPGHEGPGSVSRIDPGSNRVVATIDLGFSPEDLVVAGGRVWVVVGPT